MLTILTPAASRDLATLAALKAELGIADAGQDAALAALITGASDALAAWCGRAGFGLEALRQTERLSRPRECIVLARDLAPAISAVTLDGAALAADADYELDGSLLYRLSGDRRVAWCGGKVAITYGAGYALPGAAPADLARACLLTCAAWWHARGRDPMLRSETAEGIGAASYVASAEMGALPPQAAALAAPYRLMGLC